VEYEGTLMSDGRCFWLTSGDATLALIWPQGYGAVGEPEQAVIRDGAVIARAGDHIALDATLRNDVHPPFCAIGTGSLIVGSLDAVNGRDVSLTPAPGATAPTRRIR
jgi:hypothetical protein